ncbi:MAG: Asp/Glu racemase [Rhodospirillales bacterium]
MSLQYEFEHDRGKAMGLIVLQTDELVEVELGKLFLGLGLRVYQNRIASTPEIHPETLLLMADRMTESAAMLPREAEFSAIGYCCTSGATILGESRVAELINAAHPGLPVSNPLSALKSACRALGVGKIGIVSPYVADVSSALNASMGAVGVSVTAFGSFEQAADRTVARISPQSILDAICDVGSGDCDAVFASCTALRAMEIIAEAEARLNKPVFCSNQVLGWHMLRLGGIDAAPKGYGRLFEAALDG